jgi:hypothetical protein
VHLRSDTCVVFPFERSSVSLPCDKRPFSSDPLPVLACCCCLSSRREQQPLCKALYHVKPVLWTVFMPSRHRAQHHEADKIGLLPCRTCSLFRPLAHPNEDRQCDPELRRPAEPGDSGEERWCVAGGQIGEMVFCLQEGIPRESTLLNIPRWI